MNIQDMSIPKIKYVNEFGNIITLSKLKFKVNEYSNILNEFADIKKSANGVNITVDIITEKSFKKFFNNFNVTKPELTEEIYYIKWQKQEINIKLISKKGVVKSIATIAQIINNAEKIKECEILDFPDLKIRGIHLDLKFHNFKMEYIKEIIKKLGYYKYNTVLLEYEDKFPLNRHPEINSVLSFSEEEIFEIIGYAWRFGIEIIPLQQALGHSEYILRLDKYAYLRENPDSPRQFCPLKKESLEFITSVFDEYIQKHPSEYFHIGCDEAWYLGYCNKCKKYVEKYSREKLFINYINKLIRYLNKKGKTALLWGDMIDKDKKNYKLLKGKYILTYWDYVSEKDFPFIKFYKSENTVSVSAIRMMADSAIFPDYEFHIKNIYGFIKTSVEHKYLGHIVSGWAISRVPLDAAFMGIVAGAEFAWSSKTDIETFNKKFLEYCLNTDNPLIIDIIYRVNNNIKYEVNKRKPDFKSESDSLKKILKHFKVLNRIKLNKRFRDFIKAGVFHKKYKLSKLIIEQYIKDYNNRKLSGNKLNIKINKELEKMKIELHKIFKIYEKNYKPQLRGFGFLNEKEVLFDREYRNIELLKESIKYITKNKIKFIPLEKVVLLNDYFTDLKNKKGEFHKGYNRGMESWFNYSL